MDVINEYPAPYPKPTAIDKKRYASSSGSFIGVLNLTIDNAPTNPNESANEDLTIIITKKTIEESNGITEPIWYLPDSDVE